MDKNMLMTRLAAIVNMDDYQIQIKTQNGYVSYTDYCDNWQAALQILGMKARGYKHIAVRCDAYCLIVDLW